jgi:cytochrome c biogenesis protein ResB
VRIGALLALSGAFAGRISGARALAVLHVGQRTDQFEEASGKILNPGFSLRLDRFMVIYYPGASAAIQSFQSAVTFIQAGRDVASGVVAVNRPLKFGGYRIYQSSCDPVQSQWSGLEIVRDPGLPLVYAGYCCIALGITLWMVIRQPHTQEEDHSWKPR